MVGIVGAPDHREHIEIITNLQEQSKARCSRLQDTQHDVNAGVTNSRITQRT